MFERQFGLRENQFVAGHQPRFVYPSREHQEALAHLRYGIQNREPFVLITGEVGTGKTTAVYDAIAEWGSRALVALITNSALTRAELLEEICLRFGPDRIPYIMEPNDFNRFYLETKAAKSGHMIHFHGKEQLPEQSDRPYIKGMSEIQVGALNE